MCLWLRNRGFERSREGHTTDYLVLKNEASSLGWAALLRGFTRSPLLRSQSTGVGESPTFSFHRTKRKEILQQNTD